jgi:hypothetical protein
MATAQKVLAEWNGGNGEVALTYDTDTLAVSTLSWVNAMPQDAAVIVTVNGTDTTTTLPAGTPAGSTDISALGIVLVSETSPTRGVQVIALPAGVEVNARYPA